MLANGALYYPWIRVPRSAWFTRILLYWNRVGAIIPYEFLENPNSLGGYQRELLKEGLLQQVVPGAYLYRVPRFAEAFLQSVDESKSRRERRRLPKVAQERWPKIHLEKLQEIGEGLVERGLATKPQTHPNQYGPWFRVEPAVSNHFMAYLAGVLGRIVEEGYDPVSDNTAAVSLFCDKSRVADRSQEIRLLLLKKVLPAPEQPVDPARIADFKHRHSRLLKAFKREIEQQVLRLAVAPPRDQNSALVSTTEILRDGVEELTDKLNQTGWGSVSIGNLCTALSSAVAGGIALEDKHPVVAVATLGLGLGGIIDDLLRGTQRAVADKPLAYAAYVQRTFQVGRPSQLRGIPASAREH